MTTLLIFVAISVITGYFVAKYEEERGSNFWKTFIMSFLGTMSILIMFHKMINV